MKSNLPLIEAFEVTSRSELIHYIARDLPLFEKVKIIPQGFEVFQGVKPDILALDESGRIASIKACMEEEDPHLIDLCREVSLLNQNSELIRSALSIPSMNTVFPARGILIAQTFSKRVMEAWKTLVKGGIYFYLYKPIAFDGYKFLWIGKFPLSDFHEGEHVTPHGMEPSFLSRLSIAKLTDEEVEELKGLGKERSKEQSSKLINSSVSKVI
ncbi:MAG: hypothetical protein AB1756_03885 [Acidobacteriota bacterium]